MEQSKKLRAAMTGLVRRQEESGQTIAKFCQARGVKQSKFFYWKKKLKDKGQLTEPKRPASVSANTFLPITLPPFQGPTSPDKIEIRFPSGVLAYLPVTTAPSIVKTVIHECGKRC